MLVKEVRVGDKIRKGGTIVAVDYVEEHMVQFMVDNGTHLLFNLECGELDVSHTPNSIPNVGGKCLISSNNVDWKERIFISKNGFGWNTVSLGDEENFLNGKSYIVSVWEYGKLIPTELDINITVTINGKTAKLSDISEETLANLRNKY